MLVELGGHASSPDLRPYGEIRPGFDMNWHARDAWGTRDVLATSGLGATGRYDPAMTLGRERGHRTLLFPPRLREDAASTRTGREIQVANTMVVIEEPDPTATTYVLIAADLMVALYDELAQETPDPSAVRAQIDSLVGQLTWTGTTNWPTS